MIPGEVGLTEQSTLRLPGVRYRNPAHQTAATMLRILLWGIFTLWLFSWATHDPMPDCVYDGMAELCIPPG